MGCVLGLQLQCPMDNPYCGCKLTRVAVRSHPGLRLSAPPPTPGCCCTRWCVLPLSARGRGQADVGRADGRQAGGPALPGPVRHGTGAVETHAAVHLSTSALPVLRVCIGLAHRV